MTKQETWWCALLGWSMCDTWVWRRNGRKWLSCGLVSCVSACEQQKGRAGHIPHWALGTWIETQLCQWMRSFCLPRPPLSVVKSETTGNANLPSLSSPKPNSSVENPQPASTGWIILWISSHYNVNSMLNEIKVYDTEHSLSFISILTTVGIGIMSGVRVDFATFFTGFASKYVCLELSESPFRDYCHYCLSPLTHL